MEKATSNLDLVDLSKQNFRRTLNSLQDEAHSLLRLSIQWKEIEGFFDSTKTSLEEKAKELEVLEESLKSKEKESDDLLKAKLSDLEKKEKEKVEQLESLTKRVESMEKLADEKLKELDERAKILELKVKKGEIRESEFEPLVSFLAKNMNSSVSVPTNCPDFAALSRLIPYLDPAKIVLDALKESFNGESNDSYILLLEKLIETNSKITPNVKEAATKLGIDWLNIAKTNHSMVLSCLLFLAAYGLSHVITHEVLLNLLEPLLKYDHAPKLFRRLGLEDKVSGVVETLRKKEQYFIAIKFICEFHLFMLFPGLLESLNSSEKSGSGNLSMEAQKARREKIKAEAVMAFEYIKEKKLESEFPLKAIRKLIARLERNESSVLRSDEKCQNKTNNIESGSLILSEQHKAKRQRVTEAITPIQNSTCIPLNPPVNQLESAAIPSGVKTEESKATYPQSTETKPNIGSDSINADMLRELLKKEPLEETDLSNALKCTPDSAKLVLETSMALSPTNTEGSYEFKLLISSESCSLLFDQLKKLSIQIEDTVKEAKKFAVHWKGKVSKTKRKRLEVVCFLKFLGIFGVVSEFKANDLLALLDNSYWRSVSPDLCKFLGLENAIPDFIQSLIKTGHRIKAIDYIYSLDMVQRFQPVSAIINDALRITKESSEKSFRDAMNKPTLQVAALDKQIKSLRAAIQCISFHKLQSAFQLGNLREQIKSLLKLRSQNVAKSGSVSESSKEACSSVNKPLPKRNSNKRGQKRSVSGNIQSSVQVSSLPSNTQSSVQVSSVPNNQFAVYGYTWNQRQNWLVNHLVGGFAGAPNYNYNTYQRTQPEQPQLHHLHQHLNPFYRNHF